MRTKDYYGHSHLVELTMELPPLITNSLITSYKVYDYIKNATIEDVQTIHNIGITGIKIVASIYCPENTGYLFDENGDMQIIYFGESE